MVFVQLLNLKITDVNNDGTIKIMKSLTWVHAGKVIHLLVLHMRRASYLKKCMFMFIFLFTKNILHIFLAVSKLNNLI